MRRRGFGKKARLVPIDATKNIVQFEPDIASNTVVTVVLAQAVKPADLDEADGAKTMYVEQNCMIRGFELNMRLINKNTDSGQAKAIIFIRKNENGALATPTVGECTALGTASWKNKVFHFVQNKPPNDQGIPMTMPGIKIPKRFHAMKKGDKWELIICNPAGTGTMNSCGYCLYKWYR